jgi:hypothetical protein
MICLFSFQAASFFWSLLQVFVASSLPARAPLLLNFIGNQHSMCVKVLKGIFCRNPMQTNFCGPVSMHQM